MRRIIRYALVMSLVASMITGAYAFFDFFIFGKGGRSVTDDLMGAFGISLLWGCAFAIGGFVLSMPVTLLVSTLVSSLFSLFGK